jgi:hypothetical protein
MTEHTHAAWRDAPSGAYGVVFDHSPGHEPTGCYASAGEAWEQVQIVEDAQPGVAGWVVRKP